MRRHSGLLQRVRSLAVVAVVSLTVLMLTTTTRHPHRHRRHAEAEEPDHGQAVDAPPQPQLFDPGRGFAVHDATAAGERRPAEDAPGDGDGDPPPLPEVHQQEQEAGQLPEEPDKKEDVAQQQQQQQGAVQVLSEQQRAAVELLLSNVRNSQLPATGRALSAAAGGQQLLLRGAEPGQTPAKAEGTTAERQLCLVLATRLGDAEGFPRLPTLLESVAKYLAPGMVHTLFLLVPDADYPVFANAVAALRRYAGREPLFQVRVLMDSELLSAASRDVYVQLTPPLEKANGGRGTGYRIQMLLKLAVARFVPTEFYITMDSDVYVRRNTTFDDLVVRSTLDDSGATYYRAIYQGEGYGTGTRHQQRWWQSADRALAGGGCVKPGAQVIGVTPAILSKTISLGAIAEVVRVHGTPQEQRWDVLLFRLLSETDWTEYTLYWTYGCKAGLLDRYHALSPHNLRLYDYSGFEYGSYQSWRPNFGDRGTVFGVLQSISGADPKWVNAQLAPGLK